MNDFLKDLNTEITNLRKIAYFVDHDLFKALYQKAEKNSQDDVVGYVKVRNLAAIKKWIDNQRTLHLSTMSLVDLRNVARSHGVYNWHRYNKDQLIKLILDKRKGKNDRPSTAGPENSKDERGCSQVSSGSESQSGVPNVPPQEMLGRETI